MKQFILLLALLATATLYSQSVEGHWYLVYRNNIRHVEITKDTIYHYDASDGFGNPDSLITNKIDHDMEVIVRRETVGNKIVYYTKEINDRETKALTELTLELHEGKYPQLMVTIMREKDKKAGTQSLPLRFITLNELKSYTQLKNVTNMGEKEFIAFANEIIALKEKWKDTSSVSRQYLLSEVKYILAAMGYNPLLSMNDLETNLISRFKNNPNTKELVEKMGN